MSTITCSLPQCGYNQGGFCRRGLVSINQNGCCNYINTRSWTSPVNEEDKEPLNIITLAKREETDEK